MENLHRNHRLDVEMLKDRAPEYVGHLYFNPEVSFEVQQELLDVAEAGLPDFDEETLSAIGIASLYAHADAGRQSGFRKEGHIQVSSDRFSLVTKANGDPLLLKVSNMRRKAALGKHPRVNSLDQLRLDQLEVIAYRIAAAVGYPVPETSLITWNNNVWLAYDFIDDAQDFTKSGGGHGTQFKGDLSNQDDYDTRPIFNALATTYGDNGVQGIVGPDGRYYAQDIMVSTYLLGQSFDRNKALDEMLQEFVSFGDNSYLSPNSDYSKIRSGIEHALQTGALDNIFNDFLGSKEERAIMTENIKLRASLLLDVLDNNVFKDRDVIDTVTMNYGDEKVRDMVFTHIVRRRVLRHEQDKDPTSSELQVLLSQAHADMKTALSKLVAHQAVATESGPSDV